MKSLKKKFGKFAISQAKATKVNGGGSCDCEHVSCKSSLAPGTFGFTAPPTLCQSVCCSVLV